MKLSQIEKEEFMRYLAAYHFTEFIKNKNILITGSKGLTASGMIKWLLLENKENNAGCHIYASTRNPGKPLPFISENDSVTLCRFGEEENVIGGEHIDYIIAAAAPTERAYFMSKPMETIRCIVDGTEHMLEIAQKNHASMIFLSSVEAYGTPNTSVPIRETYVGAVDSLDIRNCYPMGKKAAEFMCFASSKEYGTDVKIARPSSIQGLLQSYEEGRIFNQILRCLIEQKHLVMKSDGMSKKSIVYSLDAIGALFTILFKGNSGEAYNITNPSTYMTMKDFADSLFREFSPNLQIEYDIENRSHTGYLPHLECIQDISKLEALGWEPKTDLREIYRIDIEWFKGGK